MRSDDDAFLLACLLHASPMMVLKDRYHALAFIMRYDTRAALVHFVQFISWFGFAVDRGT